MVGFRSSHSESALISIESALPLTEMSEKLPQGVSQFDSKIPGPSVVIMGGVHGNEPCGASAVRRLHAHFEKKELSVSRGTLTLIVANHDALKKNLRMVERNLNRLFKDNCEEVPCAETERAEELKPLVAQCEYMLDLHSTSLPSAPFLMCETPELGITPALGVEKVVLGWNSLGDIICGDTETWARSNGAKAFTLECGQHLDATAPGVAYTAAIRFLTLTGIVDSLKKEPDVTPQFLTLYHFEKLQDRGFRYARDFASFSPVKAGELIGRDRIKEHRPEIDSFVIFPGNPREVEMGTELYFLAKETKI